MTALCALRTHAQPRLHATVSLTLSLLLTACATPAPHPVATVIAPASFKEDGLWKRVPTSDRHADTLPQGWWEKYQDPVLNDLQSRLVIGNENLKIAVAQVANARAVLGGSRAAQGPTVTGGLSASRGDAGTTSGTQTALGINASASWEIDLWGKLSEATRGNEARYQASLADLAAARLSAQATLTQTYFALRAAEAQQGIYARSIAAYQRSLELTQVRQQAGVAAPSDVLQAQTQLKAVQVQALEAANQRATNEHALAVLLGQAPSSFQLSEGSRPVLLPLPPTVPQLLPSTLLQRRPDIRSAEQRLQAAYAQIGVADAGFFPSLTLGASAGLRGSTLVNLFSAPTLIWSVGPALAQKLFDGGAQQALSDQARASADQAAATYRQTVLTAFQEVEDNLVLAERLQAETTLQREALQHAQRNLEITQEQYRVGTVSYLNVVTAQTTALTSERTLLDLQARQLNATNLLLKNIAGDWSALQEGPQP